MNSARLKPIIRLVDAAERVRSSVLRYDLSLKGEQINDRFIVLIDGKRVKPRQIRGGRHQTPILDLRAHRNPFCLRVEKVAVHAGYGTGLLRHSPDRIFLRKLVVNPCHYIHFHPGVLQIYLNHVGIDLDRLALSRRFPDIFLENRPRCDRFLADQIQGRSLICVNEGMRGKSRQDKGQHDGQHQPLFPQRCNFSCWQTQTFLSPLMK